MKLIFISILILFSCTHQENKTHLAPKTVSKQPIVDLQHIKAKGKLVALTRFNANTYFLYKGVPMGYEYEMLKRFCDEIGVELEIKVPKHWDDLIPMLLNGEGDIIAANMTVTKDRAKVIRFADHHTTTRQVLVQRKPQNWHRLKKHEINALLVRNQIDLLNKPVHIFKGSSYHQRLIHLSNELGGDIDIQFLSDSLDTEDMIQMVSENEIRYTIADENIAKVNKVIYPNIDIKTPVSFPQRIAWGVRPSSDSLYKAINVWVKRMKHSKAPIYQIIYNKYYNNHKRIKRTLSSNLYYTRTGKISSFDPLIKEYATKLNWDWLLLAAQIRQESGFNPKRTSWAGAKGLMQVMPKTADSFGITDLYNPKSNLRAGTEFLIWLEEYWKDIQPASERLKFILASYNVGQGHVQDARRLAEKYGKNKNKWKDVSEYLIKKSKRKYFKDDVVFYGYCRGEEPYNYVKEIIERYEHYKRFES